jgi:glucose/arabinose dehydrogenase
VVATKLTTPTAIAVLPDFTALVGERTTGRILRVQPVAGKPVTTVRTLTGLSTAGGGGLLDLALSPNYAQDSLIFAYITTATDNRVVDFTLTGPVAPVLTGIPKGSSGNAGRIAFDTDGNLLVATGDAGSAANSANPASLAGKVLRISGIGQPAAGNPTPGSPVYASGVHSPAGLCTPVPDPNSTAPLTSTPMFEVEPDASGTGLVRVVSSGAAFQPGATGALTTLPSRDTNPGGCAAIGTVLFVTSLDGKELLSAQLTGSGSSLAVGTFTTLLTNKYGRLLTVAAGGDGSLWLATSNRDGHGTPVPDDERIIRIIANTSPDSSAF